jgi:galactonate dehydratase
VRLAKIETFAVRIPRDISAAYGSAGSPAILSNGNRYALAQTYGTIYSRDVESLIVKVTTSDGIVGWGEAQAPIAPEVVQEIIHVLLAPLLVTSDIASPPTVRQMLYDAMRVRGHFGGFYIDAVSAIDIALWDIEGKKAGAPLHRLFGDASRTSLPLYISGLTGTTPAEQLDSLEQHLKNGASAVKIFMTQEPSECLALVQEIRRRSGIAIFVDALWRLDPAGAIDFAQRLSHYDVGWLESPLAPEDTAGHQYLSQQSPVRIALGESYRTRFELRPFLETKSIQVLQPDIGRCGITEGNVLAKMALDQHMATAPHISIGLGPQIAAAIHCAASWSNLEYVECNPRIYDIASHFLADKLSFSASVVAVPDKPGLGIEINEEELAKFSRIKCVHA